jgi:hypothetical protein
MLAVVATNRGIHPQLLLPASPLASLCLVITATVEEGRHRNRTRVSERESGREGRGGGGGGGGAPRGHRETSQVLNCHPKGLSPTTLSSKPFPPQRPHPRRRPRPRSTGVVQVIAPFVVILPWGSWCRDSGTRPKQHGPANVRFLQSSTCQSSQPASWSSRLNHPTIQILVYFAFLLFIRWATINRTSRGNGYGQL